MSKYIQDSDPARADYRLIAYIIRNFTKGSFLLVPGELDRIIRVFKKAGGSWKAVFDGSPKDMVLLKKCVKVAAKKGHLTKKPKV